MLCYFKKLLGFQILCVCRGLALPVCMCHLRSQALSLLPIPCSPPFTEPEAPAPLRKTLDWGEDFHLTIQPRVNHRHTPQSHPTASPMVTSELHQGHPASKPHSSARYSKKLLCCPSWSFHLLGASRALVHCMYPSLSVY